MKLLSCYVSSFGKLKNFEHDFNSNLTVINQENGFGKTTLTVFIKSMFYGLKDGKRSIEENERKKYKPWNSTERFGGYIIFERQGVNYKIERFFGKKESEDTALLTDLSTGKVYENAFNLGKKLFEIDEEGYSSTTFFSQKDFSVKSNYSLTAKFNSTCDFTNDDEFDKAINTVQKKLSTYKYSGDRGEIPQVKRDIFDIDKKIQECNLALKSIDALKLELSDLENGAEICKKEIDKLTEDISVSAKAQAYKENVVIYENLSNERVRVFENVLNADKVLCSNMPTDSELLACSNSINELNQVQTSKQILNKDIQDLSSEFNDNNVRHNSKIVLFFLLISALVMSTGIFMFFVNLIVAISLVSLSLVVGVVGLFFSRKKNNKTSTRQLLLKKQNDLKELELIENTYNNNLSLFFSKFNLKDCSPSICLEKLREAINSKKENELILKNLDDNLSKLSIDNSFNLKLDTSLDLNVLKSTLYQKNNEYTLLQNEIAKKRLLIKEREQEAQNLLYLESKRLSLVDKLEVLNEQYQTLNYTLEFLKQAEENQKIKYRAPLKQAFEKYLDLISNNSYNVDIDIDFNVNVLENGMSLSTEYYSKGINDLFDICKRFALIDVLFDKESPFIILDDPFTNLDNKKLEFAKDLIFKLSSKYQILYFICHDSRKV